MPPRAANERSEVKPKMSIMTHHRKAATKIYLSRVAGFLPREMCNLFHWGVFLSFWKKLRKRKKSFRSSQIRKSPLIIKFLRRIRVNSNG